MPPKRPVPLTDAALGHKKLQGASGAGHALTVKNTFIDLPDGAGTSSPSKSAQPVSTAPAQVQSNTGFIRRAVLDSVEETSVAPSEGTSSQGSPTRTMPSFTSQRPPYAGGTPLMTPSPTGSSMFAAARYQLFGGGSPPLMQEAAAPTVPPGHLLSHAPQVPAQHSFVHGPVHPAGSQRSSPLSFAPPTDAVPSAQMSSAQPQVPAAAATAPAPAAAVTTAATQTGQADKQDGSSDEEDEGGEAKRQADKQAALAAAGRTPENAPKPPPGAEHPSLGSPGHLDGTCKRCCFYPRNRCLNGYECEFCHYDHEKRKRKSKKSKKKKAGENAEEHAMAYAQHGGMPDYGMHMQPAVPHHLPPHQPMMHSAPAPMPAPPAPVPPLPTLAEAPLTYQWTDGLPGQTPPPPIIPGYSAYLAAVDKMRQTMPPVEPALATNAPPPQPAPYYDPMLSQPPMGYQGYDMNPYGLPPAPGPPLDPAWSQHYAHFPPPVPPPAAQDPYAGQGLPPEALRADGFAGPAPPPVGSPKLPTDISSLHFGEPAPPEAPPSVPPKADTTWPQTF